MAKRHALDRGLHIVCALFGTLPVALLASTLLARFFPAAPEDAFALGFLLAIPLWVAAMCWAFFAKSGARALLGCALTSALLGVILYGL